jgi:uncharacterized protein YbjT (DUF2867 family)
MKIIITGATGLIGAEVVRQAIDDAAISEIILLVRSQPQIQHSKITVVIHKDFTNYTPIKQYFETGDALIWALGISQTQVSKKQYEIITYDYVVACANFCLLVNPAIRFVFVSGDGADRTEQSRTLFKRLKGKAENALLQGDLPNVIIARPDAVNPKHKNPKAPFAYKLVYPLFPLVEKFAPHKIIWSDVLARALLCLAKNGHKKNTLENVDLRELGNIPL